jgi:hypothetical protein
MQRFSSGQIYTDAEQQRWLAAELKKRRMRYKPWPKLVRGPDVPPMDAPKQRKRGVPKPAPMDDSVVRAPIGQTFEEVGRRCGITARTVRDDWKAGRVQAHRVAIGPRKWRYEIPTGDADQYVAARLAAQSVSQLQSGVAE